MVDEDFIVKLMTIILLITTLSLVYQIINHYYILRFKKSIESFVSPACGTHSYLYKKLSDFISRSIMSKIMTFLNTEIAKKKMILEDKITNGGDVKIATESTFANYDNSVLRGILVKDKKNTNAKLNNSLTIGKNVKQYQSMNSGISLQPAYIIPVPNHKKMKLNKELLQKVAANK